MGLDYFLGHLVLNIGEVDRGFLLLSDPLADQGAIARAEVIERPDGAHFHVEAAAVEMPSVVGPAAENAAVEIAARAGALHHHAGNERANLFLPHPLQACLDQRPLRRQLRPVRQADRDQVRDLNAGRDQRDLKMRRLQRNDHRAGVQTKHAGESGAGDSPIGPRRGNLLLQIEQQCPGAIHFDFRDQPSGQAGRLAGPTLRPWPRRRTCRPTCRGPAARRNRPPATSSKASFRAACRSASRAANSCRAASGRKMASVTAKLSVAPPPAARQSCRRG